MSFGASPFGAAPFAAGAFAPAAVTIYRPSSDIAVNGWTATPGGSLASCIDDPTLDRADFITSPALGGGSDPHANSTILLMHMDGDNGSTTFTDSSLSARSFSASGNAQISTTDSKFGASSGLFDGSGDFITTTSSPNDFQFGLDQFTVEFFIKTTAASNNDVMGTLLTLQNTWGINIDGLGRIEFSYGGVTTCVRSTSAINDNVWHHVAFVRAGGNLSDCYVFVDGVDVTNRINNISSLNASVTEFKIGRGINTDFPGKLDDIRITRGVARYTANFTPPSSAFPDPSNSATMAWASPMPAGSYDIAVDADRTGATGQVRIVLLDAGGTSVGTSAWQSLTDTATTYTLSVTTSATAPNFRIEVQ